MIVLFGLSLQLEKGYKMGGEDEGTSRVPYVDGGQALNTRQKRLLDSVNVQPMKKSRRQQFINDRSWMYNHITSTGRLIDGFYEGCKAFLEFVYEEHSEATDSGSIKCPSKRCQCTRWKSRYDVMICLLNYGFQENYSRWTQHGETFIPDHVEESPVSEEVDHENYDDGDNMHDMVVDAFQPNNASELTEEDPNPDARTFYKLLKDVEEPLWDTKSFRLKPCNGKIPLEERLDSQEEQGTEPRILRALETCHRKKDGTWSSEKAETIHTNYLNALEKHVEEIEETTGVRPPLHEIDKNLEIFLRIDGAANHGRVTCMSRVHVSTVSHLIREDTSERLRNVEEDLRKSQEQLRQTAEREQENWKQMEERENKHKEEMEEFRRIQTMLMTQVLALSQRFQTDPSAP